MLATMVNDHGSSWENHLPKVCFAYNTNTHTSTGYTPFYMNYGREAKIPANIIYGTPVGQPQTHSQYASNLRVIGEGILSSRKGNEHSCPKVIVLI